MATNTEEHEGGCPSIVNIIVCDLLKEAEECYQNDGRFSVEVLQALHAVLGGVLVRATELLENGSFTQYQTRNEVRKLFRIRSRLEHYVLFENINFCHCQSFKYQVLHTQNDLTCKHVLAAKLAKIAGLFKVEVISDAQITDILNDQIELEQ